ncbi:hypothetical protein [uncultured Gammaproteobacteria bacterium]|jgi:hypothetical protein|nr:hypothetical protein [uncultured Gammaproteobacteria bacterium]CAC9650722.1 hypothetical protein [uncultured Gammaproteobacteria bacterium]VVH50362.1 hypothetical protein BPUTSESOX_346 [uncultured Gammaproteobacteria bacterium]
MIKYQEQPNIYAEYSHPQSDEYIEYKSTIQIKDSGKQPVIIKLKLNEQYVSFAPVPPEKHIIRATNIIELYLKLERWFGKYGYIIK